MKKNTVPIVSGNVKYLGLSLPEWTLSLGPCGFYIILLDGNALYIAGIIHLLIIFIYVFFISKLEENILQIILVNMKIPAIVYGYFKKPIPISRITTNENFHE